jgi:hypothetical protein
VPVSAERRRVGIATDPENREQDDFYPTPACGTRALLSVEKFPDPIWEPACGDGAIAEVLKAHGYHVIPTDLVDRGYGKGSVDFLMEWRGQAESIITNPPFKLLTPFIRHATALVSGKIAFLARLAALEGVERASIYRTTRFARVWVFSRRLSIYRRGKRPTGMGGGTVAFAWFVWDPSHVGPPTIGWLDPTDFEDKQ